MAHGIWSGRSLSRFGFEEFPNCVNVEIATGALRDHHRSFWDSPASPFLITTMGWPWQEPFRLIETTMAAIDASERRLKNFSVSSAVDVMNLPSLSSVQIGPSFTELSSLSLAVDFYVWVNGKEEEHVFDWIKLFPSLKVLDLAFSSNSATIQLPRIGRGLQVTGIISLALRGLQCYMDDLILVLTRHRDTLWDLTLDRVRIYGENPSWRTVLEFIRDETKIEHICLEACVSTMSSTEFITKCYEILYDNEPVSISTSRSKFRGELDLVIDGGFTERMVQQRAIFDKGELTFRQRRTYFL